MKGIIKKTAVLLALALSATALASCGKSASTNGETVEIRIVTSERSTKIMIKISVLYLILRQITLQNL